MWVEVWGWKCRCEGEGVGVGVCGFSITNTDVLQMRFAIDKP